MIGAFLLAASYTSEAVVVALVVLAGSSWSTTSASCAAADYANGSTLLSSARTPAV